MPLKLTLKPFEKFLVNGAVIENGSTRADLIIHNHVALLRQKDIMKEENATTPARRIFYLIQLLYISNDNRVERLKILNDSLVEFLMASPSSREIIQKINEDVLAGQYYRSLQACKKLIEHETRILNYAAAQREPGLRADSETGRSAQGDRSAGPD
jgi:flagellar protein FlbT